MVLSAAHAGRNNSPLVERPWPEPRTQPLETQAQLDGFVQHRSVCRDRGRGFGRARGGVAWEANDHTSDVLPDMEQSGEVCDDLWLRG